MKPRAEPHARVAPAKFTIWRQPALIAAIIIGVAVVYLPALRGDFVWDDFLLITGNPLLQNFSGLLEIWSGGRTADYFPLTNTIFWIEHHLFGANATGYHAVNILLQIANALLVWRLLKRLNIPGAWLAGLIFGIHPVHVASVAWISELKNLLAMFFALLSVLCFLNSRGRDGPPGRPSNSARPAVAPYQYAASLVFFALALFSKTQVVFLPFILLLCAWWRDKKSTGTGRARPPSAPNARGGRLGDPSLAKTVIQVWPFFALAIVFGSVTMWFQSRGIGEEEIVIGSIPRRVANAAMAIWWYAGHLFAPVRLMAIYPNWRFDSPRLLEWLPLIVLIGILVGLWHWRNHGTRGALFAVVCFVVALLPVLGLVRMAYVRSGTLVADHLQYFADVPLLALFSAGVAYEWNHRQRATKIATAAVVTLLVGAIGTYAFDRAEVYRNEETLWQDNLSKNPDAWQAHIMMAQRRFKQERYAEAAYHARRAAELKPELADIHNQLGLAYCRLERFEDGIAEYRKALQLKEAKPSTARSAGVAKIRANLANALAITANHLSESAPTIPEEAMRRYDEAIRQYEEALEIDPQQPAIHRNLGMLLAHLGRYDEAIPHLRATLQMVPNEPVARETLDAIEARRR
ncbi:MAG TPA: tetratricopeptide repeat protein [Candidatus Udaeobacter sp.]|jgi:Flp pilus assembly protein TadD